MSNRINGAELKKIFEKATDEGSVEDGTYGYRKLNKLKLYVYHLKDMIEYIDFRTRFIKKQMEIIIRLNRDNRILIERNRKLKEICKTQRDKLKQRTPQLKQRTPQTLTTNNVNKLPDWGPSSRTDGKPRSSRSRSNSSMYANPPKSPPPSLTLSTIQESQFQVKHLLNEPPQQIPNDLLEAFAKDDRENPYDEKKHAEQQRVMKNRLEEDRKNDEKLRKQRELEEKRKRGKKRSSVSSDIDLNNMVYGSRRASQSSGSNSGSNSGSSSGFSISNSAKKKCTETYKVGDIVDVTAYGDQTYRATIKKVGPNIAMMGSKRVEIKAGEYLVIFHVDGTYEVVSKRWKREGWYISRLSARKSEEKPFEGLDLNKMDIKF